MDYPLWKYLVARASLAANSRIATSGDVPCTFWTITLPTARRFPAGPLDHLVAHVLAKVANTQEVRHVSSPWKLERHQHNAMPSLTTDFKRLIPRRPTCPTLTKMSGAVSSVLQNGSASLMMTRTYPSRNPQTVTVNRLPSAKRMWCWHGKNRGSRSQFHKGSQQLPRTWLPSHLPLHLPFHQLSTDLLLWQHCHL